MKLRNVLLTALGLILLPTASVHGQGSIVPELSYQAVIRDADGNPIGAETPQTLNIILRIWNSPSSQDPLDLRWAEQHQTTVSEGRFAVLMGQGNEVNFTGTALAHPALDAVFNGDSRYVEISYTSVLNNPSESDYTAILPRQLIAPAAMALRAKTAELALSVGADGVTGESIVDGSIGGADIADSAISAEKLQAGLKGIQVHDGDGSDFSPGGVSDHANVLFWHTEGRQYSGRFFNENGTQIGNNQRLHEVVSTNPGYGTTPLFNVFQEVPVSPHIPEGAKAILVTLRGSTTAYSDMQMEFYNKNSFPTASMFTFFHYQPFYGSGGQVFFSEYKQYILPIYEYEFPNGTTRRGFWVRLRHSVRPQFYAGSVMAHF